MKSYVFAERNKKNVFLQFCSLIINRLITINTKIIIQIDYGN